MLVFPFFALTTKGLRKRLETEFRAVAERDGQKVELLWNVSANPKYGYPGLFDREVHRAVEQIITEILRAEGRVENPIPLGSLYGLCQRMGKRPSKTGTYSGRVYRSIRRALERITTTAIKSESSFYSKGEQHWVSKIFHLYDTVIFEGQRLEDGGTADTNYVYLSDLYLQSLNSYYVKPLNYRYQRSLRSHIASRLYEVLGVKFYGVRDHSAAQVGFRYSTLTQLLPVEQHAVSGSDAKKQFDPAHEELVATGFLAAYEWRDARDDGDWLIYYRPGKRAEDEIQRARAERRLVSDTQEALPGMEDLEHEQIEEMAAEGLSGAQEALLGQLVALNVSEITARDLVRHNALDGIRKWLEAIEYTEAQDKAAFLVRAIQENWQVSDAYPEVQRDGGEAAETAGGGAGPAEGGAEGGEAPRARGPQAGPRLREPFARAKSRGGQRDAGPHPARATTARQAAHRRGRGLPRERRHLAQQPA